MIAQLVFGVYLMATFATLSVRYWYGDGGGRAPRSALYGIWNVEELQVDGEARPVALNDYDRRWRRVIFDAPAVAVRAAHRRFAGALRRIVRPRRRDPVADEGRQHDLAGTLHAAAAGAGSARARR
jgi:hypothetical protein